MAHTLPELASLYNDFAMTYAASIPVIIWKAAATGTGIVVGRGLGVIAAAVRR